MPLQGTFDVLGFADVLRLAARQQLTGRLHVRNRSFSANLFIEDGLLVGADPSEHQVAAAAGDVAGRLEKICFEFLDTDRGTFELHPCPPISVPAATRLEVDLVLQGARKRIEEWHTIRQTVPSLDLQPRLVVELQRDQVTVDRRRWRVLTTIDGRRDLRAIGRVLHLSDFDVCQLVSTMLDDGIVELQGAGLFPLATTTDTIPTDDTPTDTTMRATVASEPPGDDRPNPSPTDTPLPETTPPTEMDRTRPFRDTGAVGRIRIHRTPPSSEIRPEPGPRPLPQTSPTHPDPPQPEHLTTPIGQSAPPQPEETAPDTEPTIQPQSP